MRTWLAVLRAATFVSVLILGAASASAQGFQAIYTRDGTDVWAVGDAGVIHRSFNGGTNWTTTTVGTGTHRGIGAYGFMVVLVGDNGEVRRSSDSGGTWSLNTMAGNPVLRGIDMIDASTCVVVGDNGLIIKSTDGAQNFNQQTSGTTQRLNAVRFRDANNGWVAGNGGTLLKTVDGGSNWTPVTSGTTKNLRAVDFVGTTVWAVGNDATALVSTDGVNFTAVNLRIESRSDVTGVWVEDANTVLLTGGGGFIRKSTDGGATWTYFKHTLMAETSDFYFTNGLVNGWACSSKNRAIIRTSNSGATWTTDATLSRSWSQKKASAGTVRGATVAQNGQNKNTLYAVTGMTLHKSTNRGDTWTDIGPITGGGTKCNAFYVSPSDSMLMVAAVGTPDRITRSTNGGATWTTTFTADFTEYGVPLELDLDKPTDLYFGPENGQFYRSTDFGATFSSISNPGFRSPCDIQVVQDTGSSTIYVGDGITGSGNGQMFRSTNGGLNFSLIYTGSGSEIPMISAPRLNNAHGLSTHWSSGGVRRTTDTGASWSQVNTAGSAWGCDYAKDDPNAVVFGVYSGGQSYFSLDAGATGTWQTVSLTGTNYAYYSLDRGTWIAQQAAGLYKLNVSYTTPTNNAQSVTVSVPNGGEVWTAGEARNITWSASNVAVAHLEWRPNAASAWIAVADVAGYLGTYSWTVPNQATTEAQVRVSDLWDTNPVDASNSDFSIVAPVAAASPPTLDFGAREVGGSYNDFVTVSNTGGATLNATVSVGGDAAFSLVGPAAFSVAPMGSQLVEVSFAPGAVQPYTGTFTINGNIPAPVVSGLAGEGTISAALSLDIPDGGEVWEYNTSQDIEWSSAQIPNLKIEYQTGPLAPWNEIAASVPGSNGRYTWTVPNTPTTYARVRLTDLGTSMLVDASTSDFSIVVPYLSASPDTIDCGSVNVGGNGGSTIYVSNPGTATLIVSSITDDGAEFGLGVANLSVAPSTVEQVAVTYSPTDVGVDYATVTLTGNDPTSPHTVVVRGEGTVPSDAGGIPVAFGLDQGSNPFVGRTQIRYSLPERSPVNLEVFDLQGRRVAVLANGVQEAGEYTVPFGSGVAATAGRVPNLAAGVYFVRLQAGSFSRTSKLVLAR
jgi:photosystem II stability/assembly factor-like uncharacterized protein